MAAKTVKSEPTYDKSSILASKKYRQNVDVLALVLEAGKQYTTTEIDTKLKEFLSKPVKEEINGQKKEE